MSSKREPFKYFVALIVCQGYLAPHKIDPKLFEPKHVFKYIEQEEWPKITLKTLEVSWKYQHLHSLNNF